MDKMNSVLPADLFLPPLHYLYGADSVLLCHRLKGIKAFPKLGQSHRNHGHTLHAGNIGGQIPYGPFQFFPVIHSFAHNDLSVHGSPRLIKPVHDL